MSKPKKRLETILKRIKREHPQISDPEALLAQGSVTVGGVYIQNPRSLVRVDAPLRLEERELRGTLKLRAALVGFQVEVTDRIALDVGACTGGFTTALLEGGAARVYAVDAGFGQLLGRLRRDPRVVNLEQTNLGVLNTQRVPDLLEIITMDLSYLSISSAAPQLETLQFAEGAQLIALVKPMFELGLYCAPEDEKLLESALQRACDGLEASGWQVTGTMRSPVRGRRGAIEFFVIAQRLPPGERKQVTG